MSDIPNGSVLFFDGTCGFCTSVTHRARHLHLRAQFIPLQTVDVIALGIDPELASTSVPFRDANGDVFYGHEAVAHALQTGNPLLSALGRALLIQPLASVASLTYSFVARHRHQLPGGTPACSLNERPPSSA